MDFDWDEIKTVFDLCEEDEIEELRRDNAGNDFKAARRLAIDLSCYEACAAISFESTNMQSPYLFKFNRSTNTTDRYRWYTVTLIHGMVIDILESDEFVPLPEFIYRLKRSNLMIDAELAFVMGEKDEVIGLKELHELCRKR